MAYVIIAPTPLENFTPVPPVGMPTFAREAWLFVNKWTSEWIPGINDLSDGMYANAQVVAGIAGEIDASTQALRDAASAAVSGASARKWVSGTPYVAATSAQAASVVQDPDDASKTWRCKLDVASATKPADDPVHWVQLTGLQPPAPPVIREAFVDLGAGTAIDLAAGGVFKKTITANTAFTITNPAPAGTVSSGVLELVNAGSKTVTFWAGSKWSAGKVPVFSTAGTDVIGFYTRDGGSTYVMTLIAQAIA